MPMCRASPFPEPAGIIASGICVPRRAKAVSLIEPSPPQQITRSLPFCMAFAASSVACLALCVR